MHEVHIRAGFFFWRFRPSSPTLSHFLILILNNSSSSTSSRSKIKKEKIALSFASPEREFFFYSWRYMGKKEKKALLLYYSRVSNHSLKYIPPFVLPTTRSVQAMKQAKQKRDHKIILQHYDTVNTEGSRTIASAKALRAHTGNALRVALGMRHSSPRVCPVDGKVPTPDPPDRFGAQGSPKIWEETLSRTVCERRCAF
jgi:hypothetical protein